VSRADNSRHLQRAAAVRHDTAVQRARGVIDDLNRAGTAVTFTVVARAAGVSRGWLYTQTDLRATITGLRNNGDTVTVVPAAQRATNDSLLQRLVGARDEITRLRADNTNLREQLARSLGEQRTRR
jgi:hypothetical protein